MSNTLIRNATHDDVPTLIALGHLMHQEFHFARFEYDAEKLSGLIHALVGAEFSGIALLAECDGEIVGGIIAGISEMYFGHDLAASDYALFLVENHRGNMTGPLLIREYVRQAKEKGAKQVTLGTTTGFQTDRVSTLFAKMGGKLIGHVYEF